MFPRYGIISAHGSSHGRHALRIATWVNSGRTPSLTTSRTFSVYFLGPSTVGVLQYVFLPVFCQRRSGGQGSADANAPPLGLSTVSAGGTAGGQNSALSSFVSHRNHVPNSILVRRGSIDDIRSGVKNACENKNNIVRRQCILSSDNTALYASGDVFRNDGDFHVSFCWTTDSWIAKTRM